MTKSLFIALTGLFGSVLLLKADTIYLNSGEKIQGSVISSDKKGYSIRVEIAKGVHETKHVPMADIKLVRTTPKDLKLYKEIAKIYPTPDRKTPEWYDEQLNELTMPFIEKFEYSEFFEEISRIQDELIKEKRVISAGGIKLDGKLLYASEKANDSYYIDSKIAYDDLKKYIKVNYYRTSLTQLELIISDYKDTSNYWNALEDSEDLITSYKLCLTNLKEDYESNIKKRENLLKRLTEDQKKSLLLAIEEEEETHRALVKKDRMKGSQWTHVWKYNMDSITNALSKLETLEKDIQQLLKTPFEERNQLDLVYRETKAHITSGDTVNANKLILELEKTDARKKYISDLKHALKVRTEEIQREELLNRRRKKYKDAEIDSDFIELDENL